MSRAFVTVVCLKDILTNSSFFRVTKSKDFTTISPLISKANNNNNYISVLKITIFTLKNSIVNDSNDVILVKYRCSIGWNEEKVIRIMYACC